MPKPVRPLPGNPALWVGVIIVPVMIFALGNNLSGFRAPGSWEGVLAAAGFGLTITSPLVAAGTAWAIGPIERWRRTNNLAPTRWWITRLFRNIAPLLVLTLVGYVVSVVLVAVATKPAGASPRQFLVLLALAGMMVFPIALGALFGRMLPTVVAIPVSLLLQYALVASTLVNEHLEPLRNVFGYGVSLSLNRAGQQLVWQAIIAPGIRIRL